MVRFFFGAAPGLAGVPRILRSSLLRASNRSLIAAARLSWLIVKSDKFMGIFINIQSWWKSSTGQVPTMPSLKACALVKIDGGADSIPGGFFSFSRVDHGPRARTWLLFQREQVQRKSNRPNRLFVWINSSGRIVNKSRSGPNYRKVACPLFFSG